MSSVKSFGKMSNYEKLHGGCKACVEKGCFDPPEDFGSSRLVVAKEVLGSRHGRFTVGIKDHTPFYFCLLTSCERFLADELLIFLQILTW